MPQTTYNNFVTGTEVHRKQLGWKRFDSFTDLHGNQYFCCML